MQISIQLPPGIGEEEVGAALKLLKQALEERVSALRCPKHPEASTFRVGQIEGRTYHWRFHVCCDDFVTRIRSTFAQVESEVRQQYRGKAPCHR